MQINKWFAGIFTLICLSIYCTTGPIEISGGASDLEISASTIQGKIVNMQGEPIEGAVVRLRPSDYLSDKDYGTISVSIGDTVTNNEGLFQFDSIIAGNYVVEVNYEDSLGSIIHYQIAKEDKNTICEDTIRPMSTIYGHIDVSDSNKTYTEATKVQIFGLERISKPDSLGNFQIRVPSGTHQLYVCADSSEFEPVKVEVKLFPGEHQDLFVIQHRNRRPPNFCNDYRCDSIALRKFLDFSNLAHIHVCSVSYIENGRITQLNLSRLSIIFNYDTPSLDQLQELQILDLSYNGIRNNFRIGMPLKKLRLLSLKGNRLTIFPQSIEKLVNLDTLDLSDNAITTIPLWVTKMNNLKSLDFSNNQLSVSNLPQEVILWLDKNDPDWKISQKTTQ